MSGSATAVAAPIRVKAEVLTKREPILPHRGRYLFSVADYERMIQTGILTANDRVELIRGEIVAKMPIGDKHASRVNRLARLFIGVLKDRSIVSIQNPVVLADSEPEPDLMLLQVRADFYESGKPTPENVLLIIEVADSSVEDDRDVKGPLYAENGITEYWIINLDEDCLEVYRSPVSGGKYQSKQVLRRGDTIEINALTGVTFAVADLL